MSGTLDNKTFAVLDLYYHLIYYKEISIQQMIEKYQKDIRTIQRYIKLIEKFIQANELEQGLTESELSIIKLDKKNNRYYLSTNNISNHASAIVSTLLQIKSLTPYMSIETRKFFESSVHDVIPHERATINRLLDQFIIDKEQFPPLLLELQQLIEHKKKITLVGYDEQGDEFKVAGASPLFIVYQYYHYYLVYYYSNKIHHIKLIDLIHVKSTSGNAVVSDLNIKQPIILEVEKNYFEMFKMSYHIIGKKKWLDNGNVRVEVKMSEEDVYFLCYRVSPLVKIIEPQMYVENFKQRMRDIYQNYE